MLFFLGMVGVNKEAFITAMGGALASVGPSGATAEELACTLEDLLRHLTTPGSRVYRRSENIEKFWTTLITTIDN